jgi:hypothetical protein
MQMHNLTCAGSTGEVTTARALAVLAYARNALELRALCNVLLAVR